ncbi:MAG: AMP-binding protein [Catenulispora sp.]|nr:AMP-binding protein [Catenulispora sp.]
MDDWMDWLAKPSSGAGITYSALGTPARRIGYEELAELADRWGGAVPWQQAETRDSVLIIATPCAALFAALFGLLSAGTDVCLIAPPGALGDKDTYAVHLRTALGAVRPSLVLCPERFAAAVKEVLDGFAGPVPVLAPLPEDGSPDPGVLRSAPLARAAGRGDLLQLTSGSSGAARCVQLAPEAVGANISGIARWLGTTTADETVSWLPLYHDMGLIGTFLTAISEQMDLRVMEPAEFVRDPGGYLSLFGGGAGSITAMPPFGLELLLRRIDDRVLAGLDMSGLRSLIIGAERIPPTLLDRFCDRFGPRGLDPGALCPAYGMAEATLAVTGSAPGEPLRTVTLDGPGAAEYVSCGRPLPGVDVRIVDPGGREVTGHRQPGEIVVTSPATARGYRGTPGRSARLVGRELWTGDAGFLADGELFVIGRIGDAVKVRGTWLFAEDLEARMDHPAFRQGRAAVLLGQEGDRIRVLLVHDRRVDLDPGPLVRHLAGQQPDAVLSVVGVAAREILKTSSGKPRRREMWLKFSPEGGE